MAEERLYGAFVKAAARRSMLLMQKGAVARYCRAAVGAHARHSSGCAAIMRALCMFLRARPAAHFPCLPDASFLRSGFRFALLRDAFRQFLPSGFAIPALVNFGRDLALDKELGELASLSLGFDCHTSRLLVAVR